MATTEKLQNEILVKEEAFLKEEKAKLTEQLNKLKVEEMALMELLKPDDKHSHHKTLDLFTNKSQLSSTSSQRIDNFETETEVNHIPLQALNRMEMNNDDDEGEEEEYDDDDDMENDNNDQYSQQLMNAMSNLHNSHTDSGISRSVFHSIMQQEIEDLDEDEDGYFD